MMGQKWAAYLGKIRYRKPIINKGGMDRAERRYSALFLYMKENDREISEWYNEEKQVDGLGFEEVK